MNKKAQLSSIIAFIGVVILLIIMTPIILKVGYTMLNTTQTNFANLDSTNKSVDVISSTKNTMTNSLDWAVMILIILNMLLLFVTAFLIDVHPAFVIIYIIGAFVLVLTAPYTIIVAEKIYGMSDFAGAGGVTQYIPMLEFMVNNFGVFIVGVLVMTGIIMYAKIKFFASKNAGGTY